MTARNNGLPASEKKKRAGSIAKHISFTGVFAALCFVATVIVKIPQPSGGYFNLGDAFVLLSGWFLGPAYGAVAAGLGCALADLALDGAIYAPATLVIKAAMAVLAYFIAKLFKKFIKKEKFDVLPRILSAIAAAAGMVGGGCRGNREQRPARLGRAVRLRASGGSAVSPAPRPQLLSEARLKIRDKKQTEYAPCVPCLIFYPLSDKMPGLRQKSPWERRHIPLRRKVSKFYKSKAIAVMSSENFPPENTVSAVFNFEIKSSAPCD